MSFKGNRHTFRAGNSIRGGSSILIWLPGLGWGGGANLKPSAWQNQQNGMYAQQRQISQGIRQVWSEFSLSAWRNLGSLDTYWAHSKDSDQADLNLRWAHMPFLGFVMRWLKWKCLLPVGAIFFLLGLATLLYGTPTGSHKKVMDGKSTMCIQSP